jgi:hypothetical protein
VGHPKWKSPQVVNLNGFILTWLVLFGFLLAQPSMVIALIPDLALGRDRERETGRTGIKDFLCLLSTSVCPAKNRHGAGSSYIFFVSFAENQILSLSPSLPPK